MNMKRMSQIIVPALLIVCLSVSVTPAQIIRIGSAGLSGELLPLWIAQNKGLFKKYALDTEVITFQGGPPTVQSLLAGEIKFHVGGTSSVVDAKIAGADTLTIAVFVDTLPYTLVASEKIKSAGQLKGKRFAVSRLGSVSDLSLRIALRNLGINPEKEAVILGIGDQTSRFGALRSGAVDATVISPPLTITARQLRFNLIASFQEAGIKWAYNSIDIAADFGRSHRETVLNFTKGFIEGMAFIHKNKEESLGVLSKWMRLKDRESLEETYDFLLRILPKKPYSTDEGIQAVLDAVSVRNPKAKRFKPQDFIDMSYLQELDRTGFLDRIYQ
jgi:NitT/TauT family transport system substrate-binding protein